MQVKEQLIKYTHHGDVRIYMIGDEHCGTQHHHASLLKKTIDKIKNDPTAYWVGMGDKCEFITPSDPRWDSGGISDWLHPDNISYDEINYYCDTFTPIKDKCIGLIEGNHEDSIHKHDHIDVQRNICKALGVDNLSYSSFIRFQFRRGRSSERRALTGFFTHGAGCAITSGAKLTRLQRLMDSFDADMVAQGHVHDLLIYEKPYMTLDNSGHIKQKVRIGALTGCYFRTYTQGVPSSYGEKKNYPPVTLGSIVYIYNPSTGLLRAEKV